MSVIINQQMVMFAAALMVNIVHNISGLCRSCKNKPVIFHLKRSKDFFSSFKNWPVFVSQYFRSQF